MSKQKLSHIERHLERGRLGEALDGLLAIVKSELPDLSEPKGSIIKVMARWNDLRRRRIAGTIADGEASITENQLRQLTYDLLVMVREELQYALSEDDAPETTEERSNQPKSKILFYAANPVGEIKLHLDKEVDEIRKTLEESQMANRFELKVLDSGTPIDFMKQMLIEKPQFVHFSGHGTKDGIMMVNETGYGTLVSKESLAKVFKIFQDDVGCVVMNACFAAEQAEIIQKYVPKVIGTSGAIGDKTAIDFSSLFYRAIAEGNDISFAFEFAKAGAGLEGDDAEMYAQL